MQLEATVELVETPIDVGALIGGLDAPSSGALCTFVGRVRNIHDGRAVERLAYSAHPTMAIAKMRAIALEATQRWPLTGLTLVHRIGTLEIGEVSVAVLAASGHRAESFDACRYVIEALKHEVPIWKQEHYAQGDPRWIGAE